MSSIFDDFFPELCQDLLSADTGLGIDALLNVGVTTAAYNPADGTETTSEAQYSVLATVPASARKQGTVEKSSLQIFIAALGMRDSHGASVTIEPNRDNTLTVGDTTFVILSVDPVYTGAGKAGYMCQCQK